MLISSPSATTDGFFSFFAAGTPSRFYSIRYTHASRRTGNIKECLYSNVPAEYILLFCPPPATLAHSSSRLLTLLLLLL